MAAILGAILVITSFENSTSPMLLVCYALYQFLPESVEKNNHNEFQKIYNHLQAMAAILDAILKIIAFPMWDFGGILVCYSWYHTLPKSVENLLNNEFYKIYNHLQVMAAILDAILKIIAFPMWDFGGLLVCYLWYQILPKSVEKRFVAICWGSNCI